MQRANDVLEFWFGREPLGAAGVAERTTFWFGGDGAEAQAARDQSIRATLEPMLERAARGEFASWATSPRRRLALIILFDQVPRNAYRGTPAAFAFDREALALSVEGSGRSFVHAGDIGVHAAGCVCRRGQRASCDAGSAHTGAGAAASNQRRQRRRH